jgi:hypothetical protein
MCCILAPQADVAVLSVRPTSSGAVRAELDVSFTGFSAALQQEDSAAALQVWLPGVVCSKVSVRTKSKRIKHCRGGQHVYVGTPLLLKIRCVLDSLACFRSVWALFGHKCYFVNRSAFGAKIP